MAEPTIAELAKKDQTTRAAASMTYAAQLYPNAVFAVGNAPTALIRLSELMREGLRPSLVVAVPVGFVNVVESKEEIFSLCETYHIPAIAAMGRKGGSTVAAAICNALLYSAADMLDPSARGWQG
jgi:precorrin-8X/cobalt-precorrin-8 methylmutase